MANRNNPEKYLLQRLRASTLVLLVANLMPLLGLLAWNWNVTPVMVFYWSENLVVGFYNVLKMHLGPGQGLTCLCPAGARDPENHDRPCSTSAGTAQIRKNGQRLENRCKNSFGKRQTE